MSWVAALALPVLAGGEAIGGAYTLPEGEAKLFVSGLVTEGDHYFDGDGRRRERGRYAKYDLPVFLEYGLRDDVTLFGATGAQRIQAEEGGPQSRQGFGRSEIGARVRLLKDGDWIASAQGSVVIAGARRKEGFAAIGETDDQIDVRGLIQRSFEAFGKHGFVDLQAGYRFRSDDPANEIRIDASIGLRVAPRWLALVQSFNTIGTGDWRGDYPLRQTMSKLQGAVLFDLTDNVQLFSAAFFTPYARDALDERGGSVGVGYRF